MKRKEFIKSGTIAAAGLPALITSVGSVSDDRITPKKINMISDEFELNEITIGELQKKMEEGKYTSETITKLYLQRIDDFDRNGPAVNSVIELNPDALQTAKELDAERKKGKIRGPLHGIPVLIKDNIDTADKMMTTAGSLAMTGNKPAEDAFIVRKLREAGAVLLGKTNLSEWANFRSGRSCSGWSSRGGQTKNPYILDHNPCGSSSGSGAAVAANFCAAAVGTETDGSVTCPASVNGIVGIKPTVGLLSRSGIIPISVTQDTAGPMARTVADAAVLLSVLTGTDPDDIITKVSEGRAVSDYTEFLDKKGLKGKRIGVEKKKYENQFMFRLFQKSLNTLKEQGAEIVEIEYLDKINELGDAEFEVMKYEFKYGIDKYLSDNNSPVKSLKELIKFNSDNEDRVMPTFRQELLEECVGKAGLDSVEYLTALEKSHKGSQKIIDDVMQENKLDAIAGFTMGPACSTDTIYGDRWGDVYLTAPAAMSGYPHITVPAGMVFDLPVGISFFSGAYKEGELIRIAYSFEQAEKKRVKPEFKRSFLP
ncbi:MAG: amidase [Bacteroidetes bacterium]|nr:amidase [Bacteroidota bacterium]